MAGTKLGEVSVNDVDILEVTSDPSVAPGIAAPVGSLALADTGFHYVKTGALDTAWLVISTSATASKFQFISFVVGTTSGPTTTATTSGTAPVIAEMTKTFTPIFATDIFLLTFSGTFTNTKSATINIGIFVDGVLSAGTQRQVDANAGGGNVSMFTQLSGSLSVASHTVDVRFWTSTGTATAVGVLRSCIFEEISV